MTTTTRPTITLARWPRSGTATRTHPAGLFAAGAVATVVGAGIGPAHLTKTGLTATSIGGMVALLGGVILFGAGVHALLAKRRLLTKIGVTTGALVGLAVLVYVVALPLAAVNVPPTRVGDRSPADVGLEASFVTFATEDGVRLAGWYAPPTNGAAVVVRHGAGSTRASVLEQAAVLHAHGYGVLLTDARGHGDSDGRAMDFGWFGDADVRAAVTFLSDQAGVDADRIGVVGFSMGGEEAIGAGAADRRIAAVVAEGATGRSAADNEWFADRYGARGWLQVQLERAQTWVTDRLSPADPPTALSDAVQAVDAPPMLVIAGGAVPDEQEVARRLAAVSSGGVQTWTVAGAAHTAGLRTAPEEWERRVVGFLDETMAPRVG